MCSQSVCQRPCISQNLSLEWQKDPVCLHQFVGSFKSEGIGADGETFLRCLCPLFCLVLVLGAGVVEYFGTRINRNWFPKILGYFGTVPICPAPGGKIFRNLQDISEPPSRRFHMIFWVSRHFQIRVYTLYTFYLLFTQSRLAFMSLCKVNK